MPREGNLGKRRGRGAAAMSACSKRRIRKMVPGRGYDRQGAVEKNSWALKEARCKE
jgi:hypothetical protein